MTEVLKTWQEIAEYLRKSVSWARQAAERDGLPILRCRGPRPPKYVWTTKTLLDRWVAKKIQEQKELAGQK